MSVRAARRAGVVLALLGALVLPRAIAAQDTYFRLPVAELPIVEGKLPDDWHQYLYLNHVWPSSSQPVLQTPGEAFLYVDWGATGEVRGALQLVVHAPQKREIRGHLWIATGTLRGGWIPQYTRVGFRIPADRADPSARTAFFQAKEAYYSGLVGEDVAGAAVFAWKARAARAALGKRVDDPGPLRIRRARQDMLAESLGLFSGEQAIRENLQLDRQLLVPQGPQQEMVDIASLEGISVKELQWKTLLGDAQPALDPLARHVPHDQHAVFFPTFGDLLHVLDMADTFGTPLLQGVEARTANHRTAERYREQLCLDTSGLSRLLGPSVIASVALTGSDPYLRSGSDVAVLFEAKNAPALMAFLRTKQQAAVQQFKAQEVTGQIEGVGYEGVTTPDRRIQSYLCRLGDTVVVTNSLFQLRQLVRTHQGAHPALASLDEYRFFRTRYTLGADDERAFVFLSDAAIRRWCSPRWRIGSSRRLRAEALLADLQAEFHDDLVRYAADQPPPQFPWPVTEFGQLQLTADGLRSSVYGSLHFMTPIAELDLARVTREEADAYRRWRNAYQVQWRQFFDPIGVRLSTSGDRLALDATIMPLILGSEYQPLVDLTRGVKLTAQQLDLHDDVLLHVALAINPQSETVKQLDALATAFLKLPPITEWLGSSVELYLDADPLWSQLAQAEKPDEVLEQQARLPVALRVAHVHREKAEQFAEAAFGAAQGNLGYNVRRTRHQHEGMSYYRVATTGIDEVSVYYAVTSTALVIAGDEAVMRRALARHAARAMPPRDAPQPPADAAARSPLLGDHLVLSAHVPKELVLALSRTYHHFLSQRSWSNLPILNEWKRRYPDLDPLLVHQRLWGARLYCPGGGQYVWNATDGTMESTAFGHPGAPKLAPTARTPLDDVESAHFGLSFELEGLRGRVELRRRAEQQ
jgi:hypothetical protein